MKIFIKIAALAFLLSSPGFSCSVADTLAKIWPETALSSVVKVSKNLRIKDLRRFKNTATSNKYLAFQGVEEGAVAEYCYTYSSTNYNTFLIKESVDEFLFTVALLAFQENSVVRIGFDRDASFFSSPVMVVGSLIVVE